MTVPSPAEPQDSSQTEPNTDSVTDLSFTEGHNPASPGLHIPEPRDGFFGYSDEKGLRHVRFPPELRQ